MTSTKFFDKRNFLRDKDTVQWRIRSRGLGWHVTLVLLKKKKKTLELEPKVYKKFKKLSQWGDMVIKLVKPKCIIDGSSGAAAGQFFENFF